MQPMLVCCLKLDKRAAGLQTFNAGMQRHLYNIDCIRWPSASESSEHTDPSVLCVAYGIGNC